MNNLAITPYICMHALQIQNVKRNLVKKVSITNLNNEIIHDDMNENNEYEMNENNNEIIEHNEIDNLLPEPNFNDNDFGTDINI
jgi:hypothetical protein